MFKKNKIINGNCIDILKSFEDNSIDLIFADPPYFMQTEGELIRVEGKVFNGCDDEWDKFDTYKEYDEFCYSWLKECKRILKKTGSIWVIGSFQNIYRIGYIMQNLDFWILNDVIWSKTNPVPNFKGTRFCNAHETLLWCCKDKKSKPTFNYKTMKFLNGDKQERSVWNISLCNGNERLKDENNQKVHNTQKPEKLLYKIIMSSSKVGDVVLDPFFGTGTTGAVAKMLGRNYIGIEQDERYIKYANERINKVEFNGDLLVSEDIEKKPKRVSVEELINKGLLIVGEEFYDKNGKTIGTLTKDGKIDDKNEVLSIHKMSAKVLNKTNNNGWTYFYIKRDNKLVLIDKLRENVLNSLMKEVKFNA